MKLQKKFFLSALLSVFGAALFAGNWEPFLGFGLAIPSSTVEADGHKDVEQRAFDLDVPFLFVHSKTGIVLGGLVDLGVGITKYLYEDDDTDIAFDMRFEFELGWFPIRAKHFFLGICGNIGFNWAHYSVERTWTEIDSGYGYSYDVDYTHRWTTEIPTFTAGFDVYAFIMFTQTIGIYGRFGWRKILWNKIYYSEGESATDYDGSEWSFGNWDKGTYDGNGASVIVPSFGMIIWF